MENQLIEKKFERIPPGRTLGRPFAVPLKFSAVSRIEIVLLASYKILLDFLHATTLLQLASRTIEFISYPPIQKVKIFKRDLITF